MASWGQSNKVAIAAVVVIVLSLGMILFHARGCTRGTEYGGIPFPTWCLDCDAGQITRADVTDDGTIKLPLECPECEGKTCYPAAYCDSCGTIFILEDEIFNWEVRPSECPECGAGSDAIVVLDSFERIMQMELHDLYGIDPEGFMRAPEGGEYGPENP